MASLSPKLASLFQSLKKELESINSKRKVVQFFQKLMWTLTAVFFIFMLTVNLLPLFPNLDVPFLNALEKFWASQSNDMTGYYLKFVPILVLFFLITVSAKVFTKAYGTFKSQEWAALKKMISAIYPKFELNNQSGFPNTELKNSKLFSDFKNEMAFSYGKMTSKETDLVIYDIGLIEKNLTSGTIDTMMKIPFLNMFALLYIYVFKNMFSSNEADSNNYTFRGMFSWSNFNKNLEGYTVILPKSFDSKVNRYFNSSILKGERIHLENSDFVANFDVYATDQTEARYVLSPIFMERLLALKESFGRNIMVSFCDNKIYLAVENPLGLFSLWNTKLDSEKILEELIEDIDVAISIETEFKLKRQPNF